MGEERNRPTIVVVDDAAEVRALVRARLRLSDKLDVVGGAANGAEAVELVRQLRPTLVLLDVSMPVMDGLEALPLILEASPGTRVVMYSGFQEQGLAHRAMALGASAFLEKSMALDDLAEDLLAVLGADAPVAPTSPLETQHPAADDLDRSILREHLERFREVFEDAAIGMATVTLAGQIVRANRTLAALFELSVDDLVGVPFADFTAASATAVRAALADILAGRRRVVKIEHEIAGPAVPLQVRTTLAPVLDSNDRPLYLFLQMEDVTAQRGAEEELRRSEDRFRLLVETVEDYAIFMLSPEGLIESWNAGAQRTKGYTADEIIGQHFRVFYPPELQESQHPEHELVMALRDGHYEEEGWRVRKDGTQFWANVVITTVRNGDGRHVGFAKVTRDVSERRAMLQEREATSAALTAANARLQQVAEDQAHFLAVTAHELRTPVGVLGGTADTLAAHWADLEEDERDELLAGMSSSAGRLRRLLADLLTASRLQSSALQLDLAAVDVGAVVDTSVATAQRTHPGAAIIADTERDLVVQGDGQRLAQIVDNLVSNALAHGVPPVVASARRIGDEIEVAVSDAGPGVQPEMSERLFERFSTGRAAGGTGLGLYIVRQLARAHGGDATYRRPEGSEPGAFVVLLPHSPPNA
ncbi:PAS domain S-box protein [Nocardioides sp. CN2-186]|uniref:PAS domain S-box protein n=1 Tax=Nocardioides tweenelious TaxID=3156607 RepID=UPI0032B44594